MCGLPPFKQAYYSCPMPRIEDLIDRLAGASCITIVDLTKGYWQVPVEASSIPKTAFITK